MTLPPRSIIDTRRDQMFPVLEPEEIERVSRFGEVRSYVAGDAIVTVGRVSPGVIVILSGKVDVTQRDQSGHRTLIVIHSAGSSWASWPSLPVVLLSSMPMRKV